MPDLTSKQIHDAVSQCLADMGINRNYIERVLIRKIEDRNPEELVKQQVAKYFRQGPDGWQAEKIVDTMTRHIIDKEIQIAMTNGCRNQLQAIINDHVQQITGQPMPTEEQKPTAGKTRGINIPIDPNDFDCIFVLKHEQIENLIREKLVPDMRLDTIKVQKNGTVAIMCESHTPEEVEQAANNWLGFDVFNKQRTPGTNIIYMAKSAVEEFIQNIYFSSLAVKTSVIIDGQNTAFILENRF